MRYKIRIKFFANNSGKDVFIEFNTEGESITDAAEKAMEFFDSITTDVRSNYIVIDSISVIHNR